MSKLVKALLELANATVWHKDEPADQPVKLQHASETTAGNLYIALHTTDPGKISAADKDGPSELDYTSYDRLLIPKDRSAWSVTKPKPAEPEVELPERVPGFDVF